MKFGTVSAEELDQLELKLPPQHPANSKFLQGGDQGKIIVGCAKWGRDEWVGKLYPEGTKEKDYLANYISHFNGIELNSTFYNAKRNNIVNWASLADDDFKFCPKFPRLISHIKRLKNIEDFAQYFHDACQIFDKSLGLPFLQLADNFSPNSYENIENFFALFPEGFRMAVELRHKDWFTEPHFDQVSELMEKYGHVFVITDTGSRRDAIHMRLTSDKAFVRFNGYLNHKTDFERMDEWAELSKEWLSSGVKEIYFFLHQPDEAITPETASYFCDKMEELGLAASKKPAFIS